MERLEVLEPLCWISQLVTQVWLRSGDMGGMCGGWAQLWDGGCSFRQGGVSVVANRLDPPLGRDCHSPGSPIPGMHNRVSWRISECFKLFNFFFKFSLSVQCVVSLSSRSVRFT